MAYDLLSGLKIIEISAFVAAPLAGLTLAQLGAEVVRIDPPGGGIDHQRWPLAEDGTSLYWHGLNRAKKSIFLDLKAENGRAIVRRMLQQNGADGGIVLTNLSGPDWLSFEQLKLHRPDIILIELTGHHDGSVAVDYTVNAAVGIPLVTGAQQHAEPVNHMLPAWDGIAGLTLSTALLAALRARDRSGEAQHLRVALADVAIGFLGNLGVLPEAELLGKNRAKHGNHVFGTFGHSLLCNDGHYVMVVAMTRRHWKALVSAAGIESAVNQLQQQKNLDLAREADRYHARDEIKAMLSEWSEQNTYEQVADKLNQQGALWGPYQSFTELLDNDPSASTLNPMIHSLKHPTIGTFRVPGSAIRVQNTTENRITPGPQPGTDTQSVLTEYGIEQNLIDDQIKRD